MFRVAELVASQDGARGGFGVDEIALAVVSAKFAVRTGNFHGGDMVPAEVSADAGTVGGGAFYANRDGLTVLAQPRCQFVVSVCGGEELAVFEQNAGMVMTAAW